MNRFFAGLRAQPAWKKWLLGLAGLLVVGGGAASAWERLSSDDGGEVAKTSGELSVPPRDRSELPGSSLPLGREAGAQRSLLPANPGEKPAAGSSTATVETTRAANHGPGAGLAPQSRRGESGDVAAEEDDVLAPAALQGGFSFFAAFAVGYALRAFLKLSLIYIGLVFLTMSVLAWIGWIEIRWNVPEEQFASLTETVKSQFESFRAFISGSLPSAGMAGLGLFAGLKKR